MIGNFAFLLLGLAAGTFAQTNQNCSCQQLQTCLSQWQTCESQCIGQAPTQVQSCFIQQQNSTQALEQTEIACWSENGMCAASIVKRQANQNQNSSWTFGGQKQGKWHQGSGNSSVLSSFFGCIMNCSKQFVSKSPEWGNEAGENWGHQGGRRSREAHREGRKKQHRSGHGPKPMDRLHECAKHIGCQLSNMNSMNTCKSEPSVSSSGNSTQTNPQMQIGQTLCNCLRTNLNSTEQFCPFGDSQGGSQGRRHGGGRNGK